MHSLTVRVKGKVLLENTNVTIAAGRRYGLAGPNGMGKSTLLRLLARRQARPYCPAPQPYRICFAPSLRYALHYPANNATVADCQAVLSLHLQSADLYATV